MADQLEIGDTVKVKESSNRIWSGVGVVEYTKPAIRGDDRGAGEEVNVFFVRMNSGSMIGASGGFLDEELELVKSLTPDSDPDKLDQ